MGLAILCVETDLVVKHFTIELRFAESLFFLVLLNPLSV